MLTKKQKKSILTLVSFILLAFSGVYAEHPANGLEWHIVGPKGGDVRDLVVAPSDPNQWYFGTLDGQIYASYDAGQNWSLLYNFNRPRLFVDSLMVDPRDSKTLYMAAHRHQEPGGFHKSKDGGRTWRESPELKNEAVYAIEQASQNPDLILAGTNHGIFRTTDGGETWQALPTASALGPDGKPGGLKNVESLAINPENADIMFAGTWFLPYRSTDGGQTWEVVKKGMIEDSDVFDIDIDAKNPKHMLASACSGMYESFDGASNWTKIQGVPSSSRRTRAIMQHPTVGSLYFAGTTEGFWRSEDSGKTWMLVTSKMVEVNAIEVHPQRPEEVYLSTNNYGILISRDAGKTFQAANEGYSSRFALFITPDLEKPNRFYASTKNTARGGGFFFISDDGGKTWNTAMRNMSNLVEAKSLLQDSGNPDIIYLGTNNGIYRSVDRGLSWASVGAKAATAAGKTTSSPAALPSVKAAPTTTAGASRSRRATSKKVVAKKAPAPKPIFLKDAVVSLAATWSDDGKQGLLAATDSGLYRAFDPDKGGQLITYGAGLDKRTTFVATIKEEPQTIWVGTVSSGVLVSRDAGVTWQKAVGIPSEVPITIVKPDPRRPNRIYVGTKQTIFVSNDGGISWRRRGGGLPFGEYYTIVINPANSDEVTTGNAYQHEAGGSVTLSGGGVYRSRDGGETWERIDVFKDNLPSQRIRALALDPSSPERLLVGSHSSGIYIAERKARVAASASNNGN
jgi:photosystem II stability/assembly factor-like uncharacterized protein